MRRRFIFYINCFAPITSLPWTSLIFLSSRNALLPKQPTVPVSASWCPGTDVRPTELKNQSQSRHFSNPSFSKIFSKKVPFMVWLTLKPMEGDGGTFIFVFGLELFRDSGQPTCRRMSCGRSWFSLASFSPPVSHSWCGRWCSFKLTSLPPWVIFLFAGLAPEPCVHLCGSDTDRKHLISLSDSLSQAQG